jgi:hypothetical protein
MADQPRMNRDAGFRAGKLGRVGDPHVRLLNALVERWRGEGRDVPWVDPDLGGVASRILFLHESPGPASSSGHGSGIMSPDNDDPTAERFWRLSRAAGLDQRTYLSWNVVPWYVSATGKAASATNADGAAALPYVHEFVTLLTDLRVVVGHGRLRRALVAAVPAPARKPGPAADLLAAPEPALPSQSARLRSGHHHRHDEGPRNRRTAPAVTRRSL